MTCTSRDGAGFFDEVDGGAAARRPHLRALQRRSRSPMASSTSCVARPFFPERPAMLSRVHSAGEPRQGQPLPSSCESCSEGVGCESDGSASGQSIHSASGRSRSLGKSGALPCMVPHMILPSRPSLRSYLTQGGHETRPSPPAQSLSLCAQDRPPQQSPARVPETPALRFLGDPRRQRLRRLRPSSTGCPLC